MNSVYINKVAAFLPNNPISNDEMEGILGQIGDRPSRARKLILRSNGIKSRYYAIDPATGKPTHTNAQVTAEVIRKLEDSDFSINDIECLSCATTMADQLMPGHGVMVHGELKNPPCEVVTTSGVCMAGVSALKVGWLNVLAGQTNNAVVTASETSSSLMRAEHFSEEIASRVEALEARPEIAFEKDFLRWMLSDGAGAVLLENKPRKGQVCLKIEWVDLFSYANEFDTCMYAGGEKNEQGDLIGWKTYSVNECVENSVLTIKQDVKLLNSNIVDVTLGRPLAALMDKRHLKAEDIDHFLPHYSSNYFKKPMQVCMAEVGFEIPEEKWFSNLSSKGNTGSASVFIILEELVAQGRVKPGEKVLCFVPESGRFSAGFILLTAEQH